MTRPMAQTPGRRPARWPGDIQQIFDQTSRPDFPKGHEMRLISTLAPKSPLSATLPALACVLALGLAALVPTTAMAEDDDDDAPPAGLLAGPNKEDLPELILSVGEPLGGPWTLKSGKYYEVEITADGTGEIGLAGNDFFRAIWVDEIVINGLEIRPMGVHSVEFDRAGTMEIGFVAVKPGTYSLAIPGATSAAQRLEIVIE